jgi:hypothetical protein
MHNKNNKPKCGACQTPKRSTSTTNDNNVDTSYSASVLSPSPNKGSNFRRNTKKRQLVSSRKIKTSSSSDDTSSQVPIKLDDTDDDGDDEYIPRSIRKKSSRLSDNDAINEDNDDDDDDDNSIAARDDAEAAEAIAEGANGNDALSAALGRVNRKIAAIRQIRRQLSARNEPGLKEKDAPTAMQASQTLVDEQSQLLRRNSSTTTNVDSDDTDNDGTSEHKNETKAPVRRRSSRSNLDPSPSSLPRTAFNINRAVKDVSIIIIIIIIIIIMMTPVSSVI